MATVTLHEYIARIESLLQQESHERAITLCQYGLRSYPRCAEFYRMLGQACLETDRPDDAADMFRRVLGVDPQNFVAHVGLGVVAEGIGAMDEALWQWERALEIEPSHTAVRDEWKQLRAKRDNTAPAGRVKLNRAALGYIYLRGEQYERAANEFRGVLAGYAADADGRHERLDLQVALAEALYRGGRQREAGELCRQVLKTLPNALKPNLILGDIDLETGREDEGRLLFEHAKLLDPENVLASQLLHSPVRLPRRDVEIVEPDGALPFPPLIEKGGAEAAALQPGEPGEAFEPLTPEEEGLPDWLRTLRVHRANVSQPREERFDAAKAPEWLQTVPGITVIQPPDAATPVVDAVPAEAEAPVEHEASPEPATGVASDAEVPVWLRQLRQSDLRGESPAAAVSQETPEDNLAPAPLTPPALEATPPVKGFTAPAAALAALEPAAEAGSAPAAETLPDWLADLRQSAPVAPEPAAASGAAQTPARAAEPAAEAIPDWLLELRKLGAEPEATPEPPAEAAAAGEPSWMREQEPVSGAAHAGAAAPEAMSPQPHEAHAEGVAADAAAASIAAAAAAVVHAEMAAPEAASAHVETAEAAAAHAEPAMPDAAPAPVELAATDTAHVEMAAPAGPPHHAELSAPEAVAPLHTASADPHPQTAAPEALAPAHAGAASAEPGPAAQAASPAHAEEPTAVDGAVALGLAALGGAAAATLLAHRADTPAEPAIEAPAPPQAPGGAREAQPHVELPSPAVVEPASLGAPPAPPAREVTAFLDDSSAPPSVESQEAPTGAAEYQARLDLARVMKDIDLDSSLELYGLMAGAEPALLSQAIAEVSALAREHPAAQTTLGQLRVGEPAAASGPADAAAPAAQAAHTEDAPLPMAAAEHGAPAEAAPSAAAVEGTAYLDDAAAPESIEAQIAPTGAAQYAARLELARMLVDLDLHTALDQYELMAGAEPALLQQAIADVLALSSSHAADARTRAVLNQLQGTTAPEPMTSAAVEPMTPAVATAGTLQPASPSPVEAEAALELAAGEALEPSAAMAVTAPAETIPAPPAQSSTAETPSVPPTHPVAPASSEAQETQEALHEASATGAALAREPLAPVVSEEAMEPGTTVAGGHEPAAALPVVDASLADAGPGKRAPREAVDFLDDSAAPASVESHAAPSGEAAFQARLALARAMHFIDVDEALAQYAQLADAGESVRQEALGDLQALLPEHPRAAEIIARLKTAPPPAAAPSLAVPAAPEWLADAQTPSPVDTLVPPAEPVVAEESMEEELVAPVHAEPLVPSHLASVAAGAAAAHAALPVTPEVTSAAHEAAAAAAPVFEETAALPTYDATPVTHEHVTAGAPDVAATDVSPVHEATPVTPEAGPLIAPVVDEAAAQPTHDATPIAHEAAALAAPMVAETAALPAHEATPAAPEAAALVVPVIEETAALPTHEAAPAAHEVAALEPAAEAGEMEALIPVPVAPAAHEAAGAESAASVAQIEHAGPEASATGAGHEGAATLAPESASAPAESRMQQAHEALIAAVTPEGAVAAEPETPLAAPEEPSQARVAHADVAEPAIAGAPHEGAATFSEELAPAVAQAEQQPVVAKEAAAPQSAMKAAEPEPAAPAKQAEAPQSEVKAAAPEVAPAAEVEVPQSQLKTAEPAAMEEPPAPVTPHAALAEPQAAEPSPLPAAQPAHAETAATPAPEAPPLSPAAAAAQKHLERARALLDISQQESAIEYQALIDGSSMLPEVIADLQAFVQAQPAARHMRMLLAEAFAQAGRHQEAVEQYRKLV